MEEKQPQPGPIFLSKDKNNPRSFGVATGATDSPGRKEATEVASEATNLKFLNPKVDFSFSSSSQKLVAASPSTNNPSISEPQPQLRPPASFLNSSQALAPHQSPSGQPTGRNARHLLPRILTNSLSAPILPTSTKPLVSAFSSSSSESPFSGEFSSSSPSLKKSFPDSVETTLFSPGDSRDPSSILKRMPAPGNPGSVKHDFLPFSPSPFSPDSDRPEFLALHANPDVRSKQAVFNKNNSSKKNIVTSISPSTPWSPSSGDSEIWGGAIVFPLPPSSTPRSRNAGHTNTRGAILREYENSNAYSFESSTRPRSNGKEGRKPLQVSSIPSKMLKAESRVSRSIAPVGMTQKKRRKPRLGLDISRRRAKSKPISLLAAMSLEDDYTHAKSDTHNDRPRKIGLTDNRMHGITGNPTTESLHITTPMNHPDAGFLSNSLPGLSSPPLGVSTKLPSSFEASSSMPSTHFTRSGSDSNSPNIFFSPSPANASNPTWRRGSSPSTNAPQKTVPKSFAQDRVTGPTSSPAGLESYTIVVRGVSFRLSRTQVMADSPNLFTDCFGLNREGLFDTSAGAETSAGSTSSSTINSNSWLGAHPPFARSNLPNWDGQGVSVAEPSWEESRSKTVELDRSPDLFKFIVDHLTGYCITPHNIALTLGNTTDFFPLGWSSTSRFRVDSKVFFHSLKLTLLNLISDAQFYSLRNLERSLREQLQYLYPSPPAPFRLAWVVPRESTQEDKWRVGMGQGTFGLGGEDEFTAGMGINLGFEERSSAMGLGMTVEEKFNWGLEPTEEPQGPLDGAICLIQDLDGAMTYTPMFGAIQLSIQPSPSYSSNPYHIRQIFSESPVSLLNPPSHPHVSPTYPEFYVGNLDTFPSEADHVIRSRYNCLKQAPLEIKGLGLSTFTKEHHFQAHGVHNSQRDERIFRGTVYDLVELLQEATFAPEAGSPQLISELREFFHVEMNGIPVDVVQQTTSLKGQPNKFTITFKIDRAIVVVRRTHHQKLEKRAVAGKESDGVERSRQDLSTWRTSLDIFKVLGMKIRPRGRNIMDFLE